MQTFTDAAERVWQVAVTVDAVKRVRVLTGVDLLEVTAQDSRLLESLAGDPVLLCDVLYGVCQPQAVAQGVSDEEFGRGLAGDVLGAATLAMLQGLVDFFPKARREPLRAALQKMLRAEQLAAEGLLRKLTDPSVDRQLEEAVARLTEQAGAELAAGLARLGA